jgi:hypothetical protein
VTCRVEPGDAVTHRRGRRLVVVLLGAGLLLAGAPAVGAPPRPVGAEDAAALRLLDDAARASRSLTYSGTKYVAAWRPGGTSSTLVEVRHDPRRGTVVSTSATAAREGDDDGLVLAATRLDRDLLRVLADAFDLRIAGVGRCTGRDADVVEARRPQGGSVAGRFWIDRETGLLLRREVYDDDGRRVRSSAFVDLVLTPSAPVVAASNVRTLTSDVGATVPRSRLARLRDEGWHLPARLPGGYELFEARSRAHGDADGGAGEVLHLAYSDGLSTTSLFVQPGSLGSEPPRGFAGREVAGASVWAHDGAPERIVWAGGGRVWTLVSDAPERAVAAAVGALPHDPPSDDGLRARLARGLSRLADRLNPFS